MDKKFFIVQVILLVNIILIFTTQAAGKTKSSSEKILQTTGIKGDLTINLGCGNGRFLRNKKKWEKLFDGKSLEGWHTLAKKPILNWTAKDGVLHFVPKKSSQSQNIYTAEEYSNFILKLQWKIAPGGNSGIKYRMHFYGKNYLGTEFQLIDDASLKKKSDLKESSLKHQTGSLYDIVPPDLSKWEPRPAGSWNTARIVARGSRIEHWLNGKPVVKVDLNSKRYKEGVDKSKFRNLKNFGLNKSGRIMLQDHGGEVWFRNIMIKKISPQRSLKKQPRKKIPQVLQKKNRRQ